MNRASPARIRPDQARRSSYLTEPDYTRPLLEVPPPCKGVILEKLELLYGRDAARACYVELERLMRVHHAHKPPGMVKADERFDPTQRFTERDAILITYGDLIVSDGEPPLRILARVLDRHVKDLTTIHILPFFPSSSDRGFSITDYEEVDPNLGTWDDVEALGRRFRLMFDGVINHVSSKSRWFQEFLDGNPDYEEYFTRFSTREQLSEDHLKLILRPRTTDLLTPFNTLGGQRWVWTTFSPDQIDLNYGNPRVLLRVLGILLLYVRRGADVIRLDAATYLWCELGTSCAHLRETHAMVQLFRAVLDVVAPRVAIVTETNVPHEDNVSYFGDGGNEAQMVYNFALPPLVLLAFLTGDCGHLSRWASSLGPCSDRCAFFNFLDSHDGIGLLGAEGIATPDEIDTLVALVKTHGGLVSHRSGRDGIVKPYELNITWWSALNRADTGESIDLQIDRFIASRAVSFALAGVPGVYVASMVGHRNDRDAVEATGEARAINRQPVQLERLEEALSKPASRTSRIVARMSGLLSVRVRQPAFHPNGAQRVLDAGRRVFTILRTAPDASQTLLALTNVTRDAQRLELGRGDLADAWTGAWRDVLGERRVTADDDALVIELRPYEVLWLTAE